ncbi:MAG: hypothetical protein AABX13_02275 [Nanoarchaeota archaeon]
MNQEDKYLLRNLLGLVGGLGIIGFAAATAGNSSAQQEKSRYAQVQFVARYVIVPRALTKQEAGHFHYTLTARLPSCQAEFDDTTGSGRATLRLPGTCPENVSLEGIASSHGKGCDPVAYGMGKEYGSYPEKALVVKTSTSRDTAPATTAYINCYY